MKRLDVHERDGTLPTSARFLFYELVQLGVVSKTATGARRAQAGNGAAHGTKAPAKGKTQPKIITRANRATAPKAPTTSAAADDLELRLRALEEQVAALVTQLAAVKVKAKKKPEAGRKKKR